MIVETLTVNGYVVFSGQRVRVVKRLPRIAKLRKLKPTIGALLAHLGCPLIPGDARATETWGAITRTAAAPNPVLREVYPVSASGELLPCIADDAGDAGVKGHLKLTEDLG